MEMNKTNSLSAPAQDENNRDRTKTDISARDQSQDISWDSSRPIEALVFEGGGTKGLVYGGTCKRLWQDGKLQNVKKFAGTSAGSMAAALVAVGYNGDDMVSILKEAPFKTLLDGSSRWKGGMFGNLRRLVSKFGLYKGNVLLNFIEKKISEKMGKKNATFKDLYDTLGVELKLGVTNVTTKEFEYLNHETVPDMPLSLAVRASASLPIVFTPVIWPPKDGDAFVDGGMLGNLPINAYRPSENGTVLGFNLMATEDYRSRMGPVVRRKNLFGFVGNLMETIVNASGTAMSRTAYCKDFDINGKQATITRHQEGVDLVKINIGHSPTLDTTMTEETQMKMIESGWHSVHNYLTTDRDLTFNCPPKC